MSKPVLGLILGAILGCLDGLTALFYPEVSAEIMGILIGSTIKGILVGVAAGFFARKMNSIPAGVAFGLVARARFAFLVAKMPATNGEHYYAEIMIPGTIVGIILGFATQKYGRRPKPIASA
jgi:hypothetical protein